MNKLKRIVGMLALSAIVFLAACGNGQEASNTNDDSLQIVTTFYPMQALTNAVVGDTTDVTVMMENADAHDYEPSAQDIATLNEADVFVYNSEDMETFVPTLLESIDNPDLTIIEAAEDIELIDGDVETVGETTEEATDNHSEEAHAEEEHDHDHEGHSHETDPHTWLDPVNAVTQAHTIANALTEADPDNAEAYQENTEQFASDMMAVHDEYAEIFVSAENKTFLTQHAAFGYLANRYGLHQAAVTGVSDSAEPSPKRIADIVSYMEENNISVIYGQAGAASEIATTIASEIGGSVGELQSMESVDTSQYPADGNGFIDIVEANLESLAEGVQ